MLFKDVVGQDTVIRELQSMVQTRHLGHALLFLGPEGSGNLALALALSQYINCEHPGEDACGHCPPCLKVSRMIHPDVHYAFPVIRQEKGKKFLSDDYIGEWRKAVIENPYLTYDEWMHVIAGEQANKQGNITAAECQRIINKLKLKTLESPFKVMILWLPEYLGKEGNRLLKIIEEPPENTLFLLVAQEADRILNTILSRTQIIPVPRIQDEAIARALERRFELPSEEARRGAELAEGNYAEAMRARTTTSVFRDSYFIQWITLCHDQNIRELLTWIDDFHKSGRENHKIFLKYCQHFFRESLMASMAGASGLRLSEQAAGWAGRLAKRLRFEDYEGMIAFLNKASFYLERNAYSKIVMMNVSLRMIKLFKQEVAARKSKAGSLK